MLDFESVEHTRWRRAAASERRRQVLTDLHWHFNLTQADLARPLGLRNYDMSDFERGRRALDARTFVRIVIGALDRAGPQRQAMLEFVLAELASN